MDEWMLDILHVALKGGSRRGEGSGGLVGVGWVEGRVCAAHHSACRSRAQQTLGGCQEHRNMVSQCVQKHTNTHTQTGHKPNTLFPVVPCGPHHPCLSDAVFQPDPIRKHTCSARGQANMAIHLPHYSMYIQTGSVSHWDPWKQG